MTLFKQIALMLSLLFVIILATVLTLNYKTANASVEQRLYEDAKNTASSLSLSLAWANGDLSMISTMINANFDSGTYSAISLFDVDNKLLYERKVEEKEELTLPAWFLSITDIQAPLASANVSAGWNQVGILNVQGDASYAKNALYAILKNLLISFSIIAALGLLTLNFLLVIMLQPLKAVQRQAEAVLRNEFIFQKKIPYTTEFKDVVLGMNEMILKVKMMFEQGNRELQRQKKLAYTDPVTKLKNRKYFVDKLHEYLKIDAPSKGGINMIVSLSGAIEANEILGHKRTDILFNDMAMIFTTETQEYDAIIARMNGTEFSIFLPNCQITQGVLIAKIILSNSHFILKKHALDKQKVFLSIGLYEYSHTQSISEMLAHTDNALAHAKYADSHMYFAKAEDIVEVMGKSAWREILSNALAKNSFYFVSWPVLDTKNNQCIHNVLSLSIQVNTQTHYSYGQFMASAHQIGMSNAIYSNTIAQIFKNTSSDLRDSVYSLRLPYEFLILSTTYDTMSTLFSKYASALPFKLIIEMPDKLVSQNSQLVKDYKQLFEKYALNMGIFEFIGESHDYRYLQNLKPLYIKANPNYFLNQNEQALTALKLITRTLGIALIASGVMDKATLEKLQAKDIHIVQGKITDEIKF